jgi:hypothetical protein
MDNLLIKIYWISIFLIMTTYFISIDKYKVKKVIDLFKNKIAFINLISVLIFFMFIHFVINNKNINLINIDKKLHNKLIQASNQGLFGFIIAVFAHIDLLFAPFWFIFISSYVLHLSV